MSVRKTVPKILTWTCRTISPRFYRKVCLLLRYPGVSIRVDCECFADSGPTSVFFHFWHESSRFLNLYGIGRPLLLCPLGWSCDVQLTLKGWLCATSLSGHFCCSLTYCCFVSAPVHQERAIFQAYTFMNCQSESRLFGGFALRATF